MNAKLVAAALLSRPLTAQWLNYKTPGIPRTPDGKANLSAPAPRTADGKPDLSGVWRGPRTSVYTQNIAADLKPNEIQPWAQAVYQEHVRNLGADSPRAHCLPDPPPYYHLAGLARIVQTPALTLIVNEGVSNSGVTRTIFTDGRGLPEEMNPSWLGYSVGHWDGDTLVVTTAGFNDKTWLDFSGHPHSESLRVTERFHRRDVGHMDFEMTLEDPKTFTRPITVKANKTLAADMELMETICENNDQIVSHLSGGNGFRLPAAALTRYAGTYEVAAGHEARISVDGESLVLHLTPSGDIQTLAPQSETLFVGRGNGTEVLTGDQIEFARDSSGAVTALTLHARNGEQKATRKNAR